MGLDFYNILIISFFLLGYAFIIFEHSLGINKATAALLMAVACWTVQFADRNLYDWNLEHFSEHLADISQVVLFLLGALAIVEIIQAHGGLNMVARLMRVRSKKSALWVIGIITFFLSSVLDNLTTTIVMVVLLKKLVKNPQERLVFGSCVVVAANAGGAWTPIGDVTTTMLWVGGQLSSGPLMKMLFLPSLACLIASLSLFSLQLKGDLDMEVVKKDQPVVQEPNGKLIFFLGVLSLVFVPIFKMLTGLPPFMGILFSMSFMWLVTDILHKQHPERQNLRLTSLFSRLDLSGILFFLGILLSVDALETAGILKNLAVWLDQHVYSKELVAVFIGIVSAIVDNVPLVAACMGMYDLSVFPQDAPFWQLIAFTAGTGGSMLIIGSAAGVAFMGLEKVDFFWYFKKAALPALAGYFAGIATYILIA
jgi:Na+/H+ antiporter NhaD/arsenite permease-like protein